MSIYGGVSMNGEYIRPVKLFQCLDCRVHFGVQPDCDRVRVCPSCESQRWTRV